MESEVKNYEISYLLSPQIAEEQVISYAHKVVAAIEDHKGMVKYTESPKKRMLTYLVNKEKNAYFGWITFTAAADTLRAIDKRIKGVEGLMRHLIVERNMNEIKVRSLRLSRRQPTETKTETETETKEEKLDLEALDKKLEEILGR